MKSKINPSFAAVVIFVVLTTVACSGAAQSKDYAARNVEAYLYARVAGNAEQMIALSCSDWETKARVEASTFKSMNAQLDNVTCSATANGSSADVHCSGRIVTSYNGESKEWKLDERTFASTLESGEWRMCGYK